MRAFLSRHALTIHLAGVFAFVGGVAIAFHVALLAGSVIAGVGCLTMGITHGRVGA